MLCTNNTPSVVGIYFVFLHREIVEFYDFLPCVFYKVKVWTTFDGYSQNNHFAIKRLHRNVLDAVNIWHKAIADGKYIGVAKQLAGLFEHKIIERIIIL